MGKEELFQTNNEIDDLFRLSDFNYENIFNMYKTDDGFYAYNILKTVIIPADMAPQMYDLVLVNRKMSWAYLSYLEYGTMKLWWLICLANGIKNPTLFPEQGIRLKIIKTDVIPLILKQIRESAA
jgi:hypothetical protein